MANNKAILYTYSTPQIVVPDYSEMANTYIAYATYKYNVEGKEDEESSSSSEEEDEDESSSSSEEEDEDESSSEKEEDDGNKRSTQALIKNLQKFQIQPVNDADKQCICCLTNLKDICFFNCNHMVTCRDCAVEILKQKRECPQCRAHISDCRKIYF